MKLADGECEGEGVACLDLVGVVDKAGEQGTQVVEARIVDATQTSTDSGVVA